MPKVFIPSLPTRYDSATRARVPSIDLNPAAHYGELVNMIEEVDENALFNIRDQCTRLIGPEDYILAVGDLVLVAGAVMYTCHVLGSARVLRWDKKRREYNVVEVKL